MGPTTEYGQKGPAPLPEGQCTGQEVARLPGRGQHTGQRSHQDSVRQWEARLTNCHAGTLKQMHKGLW